MHTAKLFCVYLSLFWIETTPSTPVAIKSDLFWTSQTLEQLKQACACNIKPHLHYMALRVAMDSNLPELLRRENACGVFGVNANKTKGWLFQSEHCTELSAVFGVLPLVTHTGKL